MTDGLNIAVHDTATAKFASASAVLQANLATVADVLQSDLQARIASKLAGDVVQRRSGRLAASVSGEVHVGENGFVSSVSSDARQAGILEYGATLPPHEILPSVGKVLEFGGVKAVFAKAVHFPGAEIEPHSFMRSSLDEMEDEIVDTIEAAVTGTLVDHFE